MAMAAISESHDSIPEARILVVDDETNIVELLSVSLKFQGFEVHTAASGPDALAKAREIKPDAVILDVMMPGMDGFGVLRRMRADPLAKIMRSMVTPTGDEWITDSPVVSAFAAEMLGLTEPDPLAAQWLIRTFLALWYWPLPDPEAEEEMVRRFLGAAYATAGDHSP